MVSCSMLQVYTLVYSLHSCHVKGARVRINQPKAMLSPYYCTLIWQWLWIVLNSTSSVRILHEVPPQHKEAPMHDSQDFQMQASLELQSDIDALKNLSDEVCILPLL